MIYSGFVNVDDEVRKMSIVGSNLMPRFVFELGGQRYKKPGNMLAT